MKISSESMVERSERFTFSLPGVRAEILKEYCHYKDVAASRALAELVGKELDIIVRCKDIHKLKELALAYDPNFPPYVSKAQQEAGFESPLSQQLRVVVENSSSDQQEAIAALEEVLEMLKNPG